MMSNSLACLYRINPYIELIGVFCEVDITGFDCTMLHSMFNSWMNGNKLLYEVTVP